MQRWQARVAPSLGDGFAGTPHEVWGTVEYLSPWQPTVFFGMYGMKDLQALDNHHGEKAILWAGSDIRNLLNGYWLDSKGESRLSTTGIPLALVDSVHYVENNVERIALETAGLIAEVIPSFLGNVGDYTVQTLNPKPRYYTSVSGDDFELYGWYEIDNLASQEPNTEFHLYGNTVQFLSDMPNVHVHGRVPQPQMDEETKTMTGALRLTRFDGFSEILAKSILWGQTPRSPYIDYPFLNDRGAFIKLVNNYPWNVQKH
jgi:hypothetical protein